MDQATTKKFSMSLDVPFINELIATSETSSDPSITLLGHSFQNFHTFFA